MNNEKYTTKRGASVQINQTGIKETNKIIAVVDTETDPFQHNLIVKPFALGFYDGTRYIDFWGDDCVDQFFAWLNIETASGVEYLIYAHNGGKFDFHFFLDYLTEKKKPLIMNGRLTKVTFADQEFRDSFAIIPQALGTYSKIKFDYNKMKREVRQKHRVEILFYQKDDCLKLYDLVFAFHKMFGDKITIASAAMTALSSFHDFDKITSEYIDNTFRDFYYGGRNQCFKTGLLKGKWKLYDRNSMYPKVMEELQHPISNTFKISKKLTNNTDFALIEAVNYNCLPTRDEKTGGLDFTIKRGQFFATGHEIRCGLETNTIKIERVIDAYTFNQKANFSDFVHHFYKLRNIAKADDDKIRDILYKLILNSAYGKFAINPRKFKEYMFTIDALPDENDWSLESQTDRLFIWSRPAPKKDGFFNVATAASITGGARANLHMNLCQSINPIYCDTDSILCVQFNGDINDTALGGWKLEKTCNTAAIAGKKLYALYDDIPDDFDDQAKFASKGVRLKPSDIVRICQGETVEYANPVPAFRLGKQTKFVTRNIKMTG